MELSEATILVVEDNEATLAFLADNLTADGYEVLDCTSVTAAEGLLRTAFPDLAIVDLGLPDGDGLDLVQRVRSTDRTAGRIDPDLPMLALSGRASELDRLRGFDRGCDDYLVNVLASDPTRVSGTLLISHGPCPHLSASART